MCICPIAPSEIERREQHHLLCARVPRITWLVLGSLFYTGRFNEWGIIGRISFSRLLHLKCQARGRERERKKERVCMRERDEKNVSLKNNNVSVVTENAVIGLSLRTHCIWCLHYIRRKKIRTKSTGIQRNSLFARSWWMCTEDFLPSRPISWSIEERAWCKMLKTAKEIIYTSG